jgi:hypothetical protein
MIIIPQKYITDVKDPDTALCPSPKFMGFSAAFDEMWCGSSPEFTTKES